jgi:hypothetical protein
MRAVAIGRAKISLALMQKKYRSICWMLLLVLSLQFVLSVQHKHSLAVEPSDCASCYLAAHVPPLLPPVIKALLLISRKVISFVEEIFKDSVVSVPRYYLPLSQAPPRALLSI